MTRPLLALVGFLVVAPIAAGAQQPAPAQPKPVPPAAPSPAPQAPATAQAPTPPPNYVYAPEGRRDPFVTLLARARDGRAAGVKQDVVLEGVPGMTTDELVVRGIVQNRGSYAALVTGAAGKVYTVRVGDKLADGTIRSITPQFLVIQQQVNDPLSLDKQREIRKYLRGGENK
jgi:Tfp pilus assembly protein PilP